MKNYLKFWGTRGSCAVSGEPFKRYGGNTCCLEVNYAGTQILIDAGTGIRPIGSLLFQQGARKIDLFLSHTHWDHLIGFPFFEPLHLKGAQITIWAPAGSDRSCKELFDDLMAAEFFPVRLDEMGAVVEFRTIHQKNPVRIGPITLDFHPTQHPGPTLCFKIQTPHQTIGYATDNEALQGYHGSLADIPPALFEPHKSLIDFFKGADLLVHEAQYFPDEYLEKAGWGHSSVRNAAALVQRIGAPQWFVTHHDPKHTDEDLRRLSQIAKSLLKEHNIPCQVEWIGDGHIFELE